LGFAVDLYFKEKLYITKTAKINLAKNIFFTIAVIIGLLNKVAGLYVSILYLILYVFEFVRHIIVTHLSKEIAQTPNKRSIAARGADTTQHQQ
jgi:hypothetical protein